MRLPCLKKNVNICLNSFSSRLSFSHRISAVTALSYLFKVVSKAQHAAYTPVLTRMRYARDEFPIDQLAADLQISLPEARVIEQRRAHFAAVMRKALASSSASASSGSSASTAPSTAGIASYFSSSKAKK